MAVLRTTASEEFQRITKYSIIGYFSAFALFARSDMNNIWSYYSGTVKKPNMSSFRKLDILLEETSKLKNLITINSNKLDNLKFWDLLENVEQIHVVLLQTSQASKFLRSSIVKGDFDTNPVKEVVLRQNQTLEELAYESGYSNPQNEYVDIAIKNDLIEEDYTLEGGVTLEVRTRGGQAIYLSDVVDNISGEKMYGIDLDRTISFSNDDLTALDYKETIFQAIDILSSLKQGNNPENIGAGIDVGIAVGGNLSSLNYPSLFRQFISTFNGDDTIASVEILDVKFEEGDLYLTYQIQTVLGELLEAGEIKI